MLGWLFRSHRRGATGSGVAAAAAERVRAGLAHHQAGRLREAGAAYGEALRLDPQNIDALHFAGVIAHQHGRPEEARRLISDALSRNDANPPAHNNLGSVLAKLGRLEDAAASFRRAIALQPDYLDACVGLADVLRQAGRLDDAAAACRQALALKPDSVPALAALGTVLGQQHRWEEAQACYREAISLAPAAAGLRHNLGDALGSVDRIDEALACYREALALDPEFVEARWAAAIAQLPGVCESGAEIDRRRAAFARELEELERWFDPERLADGARAVGVQQPFYLAYHDRDNRALLERYGRLCARIMGRHAPAAAFGTAAGGAPGARGPIRIGVVSEQFRNHSVWNAIVKGWFKKLDRGRFALEAFHLGSGQDAETGFARAHAAKFHERLGTFEQWAQAIADRRLDVLIYPEIGMDPTTLKLASMRLAPVQVVAWGHPETSGLPTIDYYLSAQDMEPADAQAHYTERLVALPHLGCSCDPTGIEPANPSIAGLDAAAGPVLVCPGAPFKYGPEYDGVLARIARSLGRCRFVFFSHRSGELSERLRRRLERAFERDGLDFRDFGVFSPWLDRRSFLGLLKGADAMLDTIGFSGFNTATQAIEAGLPIVTMDGRFLRGRLASAILKRMELHELVASSPDEYAAIATRLVRDAAYRREVRRRIEDRRRILFDDDAPIRAMEAFLSGAVGR